MTHDVDGTGSALTEPTTGRPYRSAWAGWAFFGGVMVILLGAAHLMLGLVSLFREEVFAVGRNELLVDMDYTTWGWAQVLAGLIGFVVGGCVLLGQLWARLFAAWFAFLSALVNLAFLPADPVRSALMMTLDVVVIWAMLVHGGELRRHSLDDEE